MRALDDPQPFVFGHGRHRRHEAAPDRSGEVDITPIENPDRGPGVDHGLDDLQTVLHRARYPVPLGDDKLGVVVEVIEGAGKLRPSDHALATRRVGINHVAVDALKRSDLI